MTALSMENPVFVTYMIAGAIMILKLMGQGWMTVFRMLKADAGFVTPEDLQAGPINRNPDILQIPAFLACGLLFVAAGPSYLLANILMYSFVGARLLHTLAFATKQRREVRAPLYTIGSVAVIIMALYALAVVVFR
jgi:glutathione S-transferase